MLLPSHYLPQSVRGFAGSITRVPADLGDLVVFTTNAPVAEVRIPCQSAIRVDRLTLEKGRAPVGVEKLALYFSKYSNRVAEPLLLRGFKEGFSLPSTLSSTPPVAANLKSAYVHTEVVSEKLQKRCPCGE